MIAVLQVAHLPQIGAEVTMDVVAHVQTPIQALVEDVAAQARAAHAPLDNGAMAEHANAIAQDALPHAQMETPAQPTPAIGGPARAQAQAIHALCRTR
jgi:hypothetical protein